MKRVKRRPGRSPPKKFEKYEINRNINKIALLSPEVEEVFPPPKERCDEDVEVAAIGRENPFARSKSHRCTFYRPSNEDFGQLTDMALPPNDYYKNLLQEICNESTPDTIKAEMKNACEGSMVQTCSAFVEPASVLKLDEHVMADLMDDVQWQTIDSVSDADLFLSRVPSPEQIEEVPKDKKRTPSVRSNIRISETPHVKRIAEKFAKFKKNNVEVRKLEERVVCLEYDIFDLNAADPAVPTQKMRAFFSIKMKDFGSDNNKENIPSIPSGVKRNFNLDDGDLQKLNKKEIEIIDNEIPENRSLLEDLKRVLRRKQALENKKRRPTLDLMCLYEMAKRESPPVNYDYSNTNLLSKAELQEIKDLILKKCESSVYGINRRTVKCRDEVNDAKCVLSNSLINELMREAEV
ncbi:uncharacterized protein LOC133533649 [Cydia pomonella]|uniref:uncharacterized protein LOC133522984 n=1 Tax=Cydia pomonella TaxID=82600 RepID=UPI002ADD381B|nr:uncharacterized protein LOC133522984 [Cydia pomonella]XP_061728662.1 uncharacterized protein LOC133533649 [Cydia pomonella]